jgi:hypothetical protein
MYFLKANFFSYLAFLFLPSAIWVLHFQKTFFAFLMGFLASTKPKSNKFGNELEKHSKDPILLENPL